MMSSKNRRRQYLINKPLQFRYVTYIVATLLIVCGTGILGTYYGIWASVIEAFSAPSVKELVVTASQIQDYEESRRPTQSGLETSSLRFFKEVELLSERQKEMIQVILKKTNTHLIKLGFILILLIGWASLFLTHKMAGPLYRLRKSCQEIGSGNLMIRIQFRRFDEAHDVARDFNQMAASLDATISTLKRIIDTLPQDPKAQELKRALSRFKTSSD